MERNERNCSASNHTTEMGGVESTSPRVIEQRVELGFAILAGSEVLRARGRIAALDDQKIRFNRAKNQGRAVVQLQRRRWGSTTG